ncbi:hypothetical protein [Planomicrobium okeanokoites]|uniref:hypothetical protein n=1 Tax=Planomicrobium okeanokoites TaxID=244 RepID=UPI002493AC74|nr:hypothetical protein [Planomicrobium okeanokoites]
MKRTILVHDISSIKHNYFSFKNEEGVIKESPFVIKRAPDGSSYHFDKEDLEKMGQYDSDLAPHDEKEKISKAEYIRKMKQEFYHQIRSGNMDVILTKLYKLSGDEFELRWGVEVEHKFKI